MFYQVKNESPLILHESIKQMWTVCVSLANFLFPWNGNDTTNETERFLKIYRGKCEVLSTKNQLPQLVCTCFLK